MNDHLAEMLRVQHGVVDRFQAATTSTKAEIATMVRRGLLIPRPPDLLVLTAAPKTWHQRAIVAVMSTHPDAALSHGSGARLHRLDGFDHFLPMHVTVPHGRRPTTPCHLDVAVHQTRQWEREDVVCIDGIPVRTVPLTLIDVHVTAGRAMAAKALDGALRLRHDIDGIQHVVAGRVKRGRPAAKALLALLDERTNRRLPRSWFQRLAGNVLGTLGLRCEDEWPVVDEHGRPLAELDLALPRLKIGVECQSWRWHSTPEARRRDAQRKRHLRRLGWEIIEVWWADLRRMEDVAATIHVIAAERRHLLDV